MNDGMVDRYKIRSPLRCDGVGSLDCAEDVESGMRMAIRWLPLDANGDAAAKSVEKLPSHPTLPRIRSTGQVGTAAYVAMEFPEGKLLAALLGEPLALPALRRLGVEMAEALGTVHADGAFHGELSAESILMLPDGRAILWDMPLVIANRLTDRRGEERFMRQLLHGAHYLAPERARGDASSPASDLYALGAVLCLAAGSRPPPEASTLKVVHRIATGQWMPEIPSGLPEDLRRLLARMLASDPAHRPTAKEAAAQLGAPAEAGVAAPAPASVAPLVTAPVAAPAVRHAAVTEPELPAVKVTPAAVVAPSIEVATDQIRAADVDFIEKAPPRRSMWLAAAGLSALMVAGGVLALLNLPRRSSSVQVAQVSAAPPAPVAPPSMTTSAALSPETAPQAADGLLEPLVGQHSKHGHLAKRRAAGVKAPAENASAAPQSDDRDFSFLAHDAQAPKDELKRPSF